MPPQQPQLDPNVVNLAKAIRQTESQGNFQALGKSGEYGAYQFMPDTWSSLSQKYLGQPVDIKQATPEQQNEVAYKRILDLKNQGYNPGQIASIWNSGSPEWEGKTGTNKKGVAYDVPTYVNNVYQAYQQFKGTGQTAGAANAMGSIFPTAQASTQQTPENPQAQQDWLSKSANFLSSIFPGKQIGESIGTLGGYLYTKAYDAIKGTHFADNYDLSSPTPLQTTADAAQAAIMTGMGLPGGGVSVFGKAIPTLATPLKMGARIAQNALIGGAYGLTGAVASGETKPESILKQTAGGLAVGGVAGGLGEIANTITENLPGRLVKSVLPQLKNEDTINYAIKNVKLGSVNTMVEESQKALDSYDNQISALLSHPDNAGKTVNAADILGAVKKAYPNSEYDVATILDKMKTQVPTEASLITKLGKGQELTLEEANILRQATDRITYKTKIDSPEVRAGKDLAATVGNALRNEVQTQAKETAPIFANYSKEIRLNKALRSLATKQGKGGLVNMKELMGILGGGSIGGLPGAAATAVATKIGESPTVRLGAAKALSAATPAIKGATTVARGAATLAPGTISKIGGKQSK